MYNLPQFLAFTNATQIIIALLLIRSCDASAGSCDLVVDALLDGITEWEGITMETSGIDHYHSYQLLQTILHLSSLLLEVMCTYNSINYAFQNYK